MEGGGGKREGSKGRGWRGEGGGVRGCKRGLVESKREVRGRQEWRGGKRGGRKRWEEEEGGGKRRVTGVR